MIRGVVRITWSEDDKDAWLKSKPIKEATDQHGL